MTDSDNNKHPLPIASAAGQPYTRGWCKFWRVLNRVIAICMLGTGAVVFTLILTGHTSLYADVFLSIILGGIVLNLISLPMYSKSCQHSAIHIYDTHITAKWTATIEAEKIVYESIHSVKSCGTRQLELGLCLNNDVFKAYFYFDDNNAELFEQLINEKRYQTPAGE